MTLNSKSGGEPAKLCFPSRCTAFTFPGCHKHAYTLIELMKGFYLVFIYDRNYSLDYVQVETYFLRAEFILPNAFFSHGWQEQLTAN